MGIVPAPRAEAVAALSAAPPAPSVSQWSFLVSFGTALSAGVGLASLAGWVFDVSILKSGLPGQVDIKANTSVGLILLGIALWLRKAELKQTRGRIFVAQTLAGLAAVIGVASFGEYLFGWDLGIDQLLFVEKAGAIGTIRPGLMAPINAINFVLLGLAVIFLDWTTRRGFWPSQLLSFTAGLLALFNVLDFILAPREYHTHTSFPAAVAIAFLSLAVICARPGLAYGAGSGVEESMFRRWFFQGFAPELPQPLRYGGALLLVAGATMLHSAMEWSLGITLTPFITFYPAIFLAAAIGGLGPGILATSLTGLAAAYFFLDPRGIGVEKLGDVVGMTIFLPTGIGISVLAENLERMRRQSSNALRKASSYTRSLIEASLDPLVTISPEGKITDVNQATEEATGLPRSALIGTDFAGYFTEPGKARAGYREAFDRGYVTDHELALRHVSGKVMDVLYRARVYRDAEGAVAGVFAAARDITKRKGAEAVLRAASLYTRSLIEASLDPLVTISPEGKITDVNKATEDATGIPRSDLVGTDFASYFTEPEKARAGYRQVLEQGRVTDYPLAIRHLSGKIIDVLYNASLYRDEKGSVAGVFAAARDVTERKRAEAELAVYHQHLEDLVAQRTAEIQSTNKRLEGANRELETFAYSVSHDLRTPLRAVDGFSRILLEDYAPKLDDEGRRVVNVIRDSTRKMAQMIDDILAFSRAGRLQLSMQAIDMDELVREAMKGLEPALADGNVKVEIRPLPGSHGDASMIQRVWTNLLDNAIKFTRTKPGGAVEVGARARDHETIYYVKDNGVGFDMQYAHKLFGVFQRLHGPEEFPGTGIGLAIVKRIVERHGGRVWAEGKVGQGATIYFALPDGVKS